MKKIKIHNSVPISSVWLVSASMLYSPRLLSASILFRERNLSPPLTLRTGGAEGNTVSDIRARRGKGAQMSKTSIAEVAFVYYNMTMSIDIPSTMSAKLDPADESEARETIADSYKNGN